MQILESTAGKTEEQKTILAKNFISNFHRGLIGRAWNYEAKIIIYVQAWIDKLTFFFLEYLSSILTSNIMIVFFIFNDSFQVKVFLQVIQRPNQRGERETIKRNCSFILTQPEGLLWVSRRSLEQLNNVRILWRAAAGHNVLTLPVVVQQVTRLQWSRWRHPFRWWLDWDL